MTAPDKIYVREYPDGVARFWEEKKKDDVVATIPHEYIRKDALLEWANEHYTSLDITKRDMWDGGYNCAMKELIDKLNSL